MATPEVGDSSRVEVGGVLVHCLVTGDPGSPIILLHGASPDAGSLSWRPSIENLAAKHRVFVPDLPGHGESDKPRLEYSMQFYVDCLEDLMDVLGIESAIVAGVSLGGATALGLAIRRPDKVEKLILVGSYGLGSRVPFPVLSYMSTRTPLLDEAVLKGMCSSRTLVRWGLRSAIFHDRRAIMEELVEEVREQYRKPGLERCFGSFRRSEVTADGLRTSYVGALGRVEVPTLIVHGQNDRLVPVSQPHEAHVLMPESELHVMANCGHWPSREKPEEFNRVVRDFLV